MAEGTKRGAVSCAADMLFHLARAAVQGGEGTELTPAQWAALRFFSRASRPSRTPSGFARYHATTRGTASQTVKSLERGGYLQRVRSTRDGRSVVFEPTPAGHDRLADDPVKALEDALETLPDEMVRQFSVVLQASMGRVARRRGGTELGTCGDCENLARGTESDPPEMVCGCTGERLAADDFTRLCVHFSPHLPGDTSSANKPDHTP